MGNSPTPTKDPSSQTAAFTMGKAPALEKVGKISETITFNGTFDFPSVYRGYPNVDVDAAWKRITKVGPFSLTAEDVIKMGKSAEECSKLPEELGGGYMGTVEVFHQLHCLDMIRKYTYLDYYLHKNRDYWGNPLMRVHIDHCIEMLRQVLMCNSDLGVITYNFVEIRPEAWPDFNTVHRCRNFEDVLNWYHERELHTTGSKYGTQITKTAGAYVVATPP
ncbi:hypothetical protein F5Y10DRAFT_259447 [Nemania abortiva]|nr:hypothetical protein F5Y10DRAFT_259447 [Nemania abortiva]